MRIDSNTDIGIKRKENQDNYWSAVLDVDNNEYGIVCLCDGMGGLNNGGLASRMVVNEVRDYLRAGNDFIGLREVLDEVNVKVNSVGVAENVKMGTTCTVLCCSRGKYQIYHVGDSRCYKISKGVFSSLTEDHSVLRKYGITKKENINLYNKYKNTLTRSIGVKPTVMLDYLEGSYSEGDAFLLCSDGFWHYLDENSYSASDILNLKSATGMCMGSGETDNITVSVLYV